MIDLSTIEYILLFLHERYHCCFSNEERTELKYGTENIFMLGLFCSIQCYCEFSNCGILGKRIPIACDFKTNLLAIISSLLSSPLSLYHSRYLSSSFSTSFSFSCLTIPFVISLFLSFCPPISLSFALSPYQPIYLSLSCYTLS